MNKTAEEVIKHIGEEKFMEAFGPRTVFVFGANCQGIHKRGAALTALQHYGARMGTVGYCGHSYGIATKETPWKTLPLDAVKVFVDMFLEFARTWEHFTFKVTRVGCGLAGFTNEQIAPMFVGSPDNCEFDPAWAPWGLKSWTEAPLE